MITHCIGVITTWLIKHEAIEAEDRELYEYAVYSLILTFSPLILIIIIGGLMGVIKESILLILPFMIIRKFSGGFHAKHDWTCLCGSCVLLFLCVFAATNIKCGIVLDIITIAAVISLIVCSPIDSENRRLQGDEKKRYKLVTAVIALSFEMVYLMLLFFRADTYAVCIAVGLILSAGLQVPCMPQMMKTK